MSDQNTPLPDDENEDLSPDTGDETTGRFEKLLKEKPWIAWVTIGALILVACFFAFFPGGGGDEESGEEEPTQQTSEIPWETSDGGSDDGGNEPAEPSTEPTPEETTEEEETSDDVNERVRKFANLFVSQVNDAKDGKSLAKSVDGIATTPLAVSLKTSTFDALPKDGKVGNVGTTSGDDYTADVAYDGGEKTYTLTIRDYGDGDMRVVYMDIPEDGERHLDDQGYPIPAPVAPLDADSADSMRMQALGIVKLYGEHQGGSDPKAREKSVKEALNGGKAPGVPNYGSGGEDFQLFSPYEIEVLDGVNDSGAASDAITVHIRVAVGNAKLEDPPVEGTLNVLVDFKWDKDSERWVPAQMRQA